MSQNQAPAEHSGFYKRPNYRRGTAHQLEVK